MLPLQHLASVEEVENVYLFIADSIRDRSTSEAVKSLGVSGRAIAASTYTASSFPSILSGQYPATHSVWSFDDQLPERPALLTGSETFGMNAETIWTDLPPGEKPPFRMIRATADDASTLSETKTPFIAVEHHKGGHMPYGFMFKEYDSTIDFFTNERPSLEDLSALYKKSVRTAEERFLTAVDHLEDRGLLEKTLVIYTSDHGEALGEVRNSATVGHGDPISPDLVNVPIVFAGANLPDADLNTVLSGIDIAPTALSAVGRSDAVGRKIDGEDCWAGKPDHRLLRSERWVTFDAPFVGELDRYRATSVWDANGGIVFHKGSRPVRVTLAIGNEFIKAPWAYLNRNPLQFGRWLSILRGYATSTLQYGNPKFTIDEATTETVEFHESNVSDSGEVNREQLRKLGYLE